MDPSKRLRVAVAAVPHLLGDTFRALLGEHVDVTIVVEPRCPGSRDTEDTFDIALVVAGSPPIAAPVRVLLDDRPESRGGGAVVDAEGQVVRQLADVHAVVDLVLGLAREAEQAS